MADQGDAEADQVVGRQVRQDVPVDFVVAERRLVLRKTELLQPARDIDRHYGSLSGENPPSADCAATAIGSFTLSGIAGEAKPALVEALKLNANLNLLARMHPF
jgi:hypothetical protein